MHLHKPLGSLTRMGIRIYASKDAPVCRAGQNACIIGMLGQIQLSCKFGSGCAMHQCVKYVMTNDHLQFMNCISEAVCSVVTSTADIDSPCS